MIFPDPQLKKLLEKIFDRWQGDRKKTMDLADYRRWRHDFAFHMTDWLGDLRKLVAFYGNPQKTTAAEANEVVVGFLFHAIPRLKGAGRLLLEDVPDAYADLYHEFPTRKRSTGEKKKTRKVG